MKAIIGLIDPDEGHRHAPPHPARLYCAGSAERAPPARSRPCSPPTPSEQRSWKKPKSATTPTGLATFTIACSRSTPTPRRRARRASCSAWASTRRCRAARSTAIPAAGRCASRSRRCCFRSLTCCFSTSRRTTSISKRRLWLENFLKSYAGTLIVISHERDLLNNVVDTILHLERGKITLYSRRL